MRLTTHTVPEPHLHEFQFIAKKFVSKLIEVMINDRYSYSIVDSRHKHLYARSQLIYLLRRLCFYCGCCANQVLRAHSTRNDKFYFFFISRQVLHTSHSTLDRTCSDSVVSLRCRKSTSDLTNVNDNNGTPVVTAQHRRRGSSKVSGGCRSAVK